VVAWEVAEVESAEIAAELVKRAWLRERYCRPRGLGSRQSQQQPLILHADNGNAVAAGFREAIARRHARIKARRAGCAALVLQAEGQQRQPLLGITVPHSQVSTGIPQPAVRQQGAGLRVGCGIKFVTPHQRHSGAAITICRERAQVYEKTRQAHPNRWSQSTRCWRQPVVVWINKQTEGHQSNQALPFIQVA
jgi:putative transposase